MNISNTVATRDAAPAKLSPQAAIKQGFERYREPITKLLPAGTNVEQFIANVTQACRATPELFKCSTESVLGAALRCAQLGLPPNDGTNRAWIIPYGGQAQFQLGYGGVMELARRATPGLRFDGRPVYPNDQFDVDYGKPEPLTHRPAVTLGLPRGGEPIAWYVRAIFPDGTQQVAVLDKDQVEYHRGFSKQPNGTMWNKSYDAAALKSGVIELKRWLASSTTLASAIASDEQILDVREAVDLGEITHDVNRETGEIIDAEEVTE